MYVYYVLPVCVTNSQCKFIRKTGGLVVDKDLTKPADDVPSLSLSALTMLVSQQGNAAHNNITCHVSLEKGLFLE